MELHPTFAQSTSLGPPPGTVAAIYARVSPRPAKPGKKGLDMTTTIEEQVRVCRSTCEARGWRVRYVLSDRMESAKDLDRPNLQRLLTHVEEGKIGVVVVWKLDRMWRSLRDTVNLFEFFREANVAFHSCTESFDNTSPFGRFVFRNVASAAELERELIRERTRMALHWRAREGIWLGRCAPFGYSKDTAGQLTIREDEAATVRLLYGLYLRHRSMGRTADELNSLGKRTRDGFEWTEAKVQRILAKPLYGGRMEIAGVEKVRADLRIVADGAFEAVRAIRRDTSKRAPRSDRDILKSDAVKSVFAQYARILDDQQAAGELAAEDPLGGVLAGLKEGGA